MSLADVNVVDIDSPKEFALLELPLFNIFLSWDFGLAGNVRLAEAAAISIALQAKMRFCVIRDLRAKVILTFHLVMTGLGNCPHRTTRYALSTQAFIEEGTVSVMIII